MASAINKGGAQYFGGGLRSRQRLFSGQAATVTLVNSNRNAVFLFDRAAGITYTLPAPVPGISIRFITTVTITSNSYKVITNTGTVFILGPLVGMNSASSEAMLAFLGNGTTHVAITNQAAGSSATGGFLGGDMTLTCVSTTLWQVSGTYQAGTTATTPFATS